MRHRSPQGWFKPPVAFPDAPMHVFLEQGAQQHPDRVAILFDDKQITYGDLYQRATQVARLLRGLGLGFGSRVALAASNSPMWIAVQLGVSMAGAATVLLNSSWRSVELAHALSLTDPDAIVADAAVARELGGSTSPVPALRLGMDDGAPGGWQSLRALLTEGPSAALASFDGVDLATAEALLPFSSGTTGMPKAVRHSHRGCVIGALTRAADFGFTADDRLQYFMPLFTIYGVSACGSVFAAGASMRLFRRFDAETAMRSIEHDRITIAFAGAPIAVALRDLDRGVQVDCSSLRYMMWAATPIVADVAHDVSRRFGIRWFPAYGATETLIAASPIEAPETWRLDAPGIPMSGIVVKAVDLETGRDLPDGETGELVVRSDGMMLGYLPEEANEGTMLPDGFWRTGDIGWIEPQGWIHLTDRAKELIKSSGFQVAPVELERVVFEIPGVVDCAVYGLPDEHRGEAPTAAIVRNDETLTAEAVKAYVAARVARYKHLRSVRFVDAIPRNAGGKVLRRVLRDEDLAGMDGRRSAGT